MATQASSTSIVPAPGIARMLQRVISIKNVGRFRNCAAAGDVALKRYTLIFGENARGKTTFCDILRSLASGNPDNVIGRKTLGSAEPSEIKLLTESGVIAFQNEAWNAPYPDIAMFDGTYVKDNVFAGDSVDKDHRRNLYQVIIGARGVELAATLDVFENQIKEKTLEIRDNRRQIERHIPPSVGIESFLSFVEDAEIGAKIVAKELELESARQSAQLQQKAGLTPLTIPIFPTSFATLLAKTFENISADAERRVGEHIAHHGMQSRGEAWITEGLQYVVDGVCPFCSQPLNLSGLIEDYRSFFSREYHTLRDEVTALKRQVDTALGERVAAAMQQTVLQNASTVESWRQYCDLTVPSFADEARMIDIVGALRQSAQGLLDVKAGSPLDAVAPDGAFAKALSGFESLRSSFGTYNASVAVANAAIVAKKRQALTANAHEIENALALLRSQKIRFVAEVATLCEQDARLQSEKVGLENEKVTAREQLDAHTAQVITQYGQRINWYLDKINASFRITTPTHTYRGGPPSTTYQIVINQTNVDLGDPTTPSSRPSFKNTLSGGDRSTLALAFFFAQLEKDANRVNKIIVFDDPFASMDGFRRNHTVHQIYRCGEACAQVIVLSHDPGFLHLLWNRLSSSDRKALAFARIGEENTTIVDWDIERAVQARFRADIDTLQRFFSDGQCNSRDVIQKIRPILEAYCRNLFATQFSEQEMLGSIVTKIQDGGSNHALFPIVEDLEELNVYTRRYHHGESPSSAATEPVDDSELLGYVKRTLRIVGCLT